jgi:Zc3h12a-like Ribonuclease NYN domain
MYMLNFIFPLAEITMLRPPPSSTSQPFVQMHSEPLILAGLLVLVLLLFVFGLRKRIALRRSEAAGPKNWIVIDGSNVMHWKDNTAQIATVRAVIQALKARGFTPGVVFDANAGYKIGDRYKDDWELAKLLNLPEKQVLVVPKGTPADPYLLQAARDLGARVVTNDRYRDWAQAHPEVRTPGFLIRGGYRKSGELWLDEVAPEQAAVPA